jgi:hypothetical protein
MGPVGAEMFLANRQTDRQTDIQTETDRQTDIQTDRQTYRQTDTHTDRQRDNMTTQAVALRNSANTPKTNYACRM